MEILGLLVNIFITLLLLPENENKQMYPSILTLLNQKIVLVLNNGIHFYDSNLDNEEEGKFIPLNITKEEDNYKATLAQFSYEDDGYILILVMDILYFFKADGTFITSSDVSDFINNEYYCLVSYKKENNYLNYIISYTNQTDKTLILHHFKFDIINKINQQENKKIFNAIVVGKDYDPLNIVGGTCIILLDYSNNDLLTCFYSIMHPVQFHSRSFDPNNDFNELTDKSTYFNATEFESSPPYISAITNSDKRKALIYAVNNGYSYWQTFDFYNSFSSLSNNSMDNINILYPKHKMYYFRQSHEFVLLSQSYYCNIFITVFNNNFTLKTTNNFLPDNCYVSYFSTIFYNGNYYFIVNDNQDGNILHLAINNSYLGDVTNYEEPIEITNIIESDINTDSSENDINIETSENDIYTESPENDINTESSDIDIKTESSDNDINTESSDSDTNKESSDSDTNKESSDNNINTESSDNDINTESSDYDINTESSDYDINTESSDNDINTESSDNDINTESIENIENYSNNIKCKYSTFDSSKYDLCTLCNTEKGYYPAEIQDDSLFGDYVECFNDNTKPQNFYFNSTINKYRICYYTCLICNEDGDENNNNCITCSNNYIKSPDYPNSKNCVTKCLYSYYYDYGQYKCTDNSYCPEKANLYIKELKKCTNDCSKEDKYKYQYEGICLEKCPNNTKPNTNNICIEDNINSCSKSENEIELQEFLTSGGIDAKAKNYAKEFGYTEKHVSYFYNSQYSILLYQELNCLDELSISLAKIDFGTCYNKIQESISPINKKIIIGLIERLNGKDKSTITFFFYHPITGEKLDINNICKDEEVIVKESVMSQLNSSNIDLNSVLFLTDQNINIFDLSNEFYTDICYHFESPNGKDVPLKERIHIFYPNISLCDSGCKCKGINLTKMESICECKFMDILSNELVEGNALIGNSLEEVSDLMSNSNLDVLFCFKDVFKKEYIANGIGGFIIIAIFIIEIIFSIIFLIVDMNKIMKYLYNISEKYINLVSKNMKDIKYINITMKEPPKKKRYRKRNTDKFLKIDDKNNLSSIFKKSDVCFRPNNIMFNSPESFKDENNFASSKDNNFYSKNKLNKENIRNKISDDEINEYLKTDLDEMDYDDAVKFDKRTFMEYFKDRIVEKQMLANTFCNKESLIPISIKIILFLLNIDLYFSINGLFYSEEYLIELYH